jgi:hypothetical protein
LMQKRTFGIWIWCALVWFIAMPAEGGLLEFGKRRG